MVSNFYFSNFTNSQEQTLIEDLIIESISIYGLDMYYIPRTAGAYDELYTQDSAPRYESAWLTNMYIRNVDGFNGDGDFLSKFGLEIRDRITFTVARKTFNEEVGVQNDLIRPREGDLIYFPLNKKIFQIKFVEHEAIFYQMGSLQTWDLQCELFEYSNEQFNTGIADIDDLDDKYTTDISSIGMATEDGFILIDETQGIPIAAEDQQSNSALLQENDYFQVQANSFIDWSDRDPFSENGLY